MNGGLAMNAVKAYVNADALTNIITLPTSFTGKEVEITIRETGKKQSIVDKYAGFAAGLNMSAEDVRDERLRKYEVAH